MGEETKKPVSKSSAASKPVANSNSSNDLSNAKKLVYDNVKSSIDTKTQHAIASGVNRGSSVLRQALTAVPSTEAGIARNVLAATGAIGNVASKALPIVAGGVPTAIQVMTGNGTRGSSESATMMKSDDIKKQWQDRATKYRPKYQMTITQKTVKNPTYSGQSAMSKALKVKV